MFAEKYQFFVEIANSESISKAANKMLISQPALSKYLSRLEASLNTELFDRSTHPLRLTKAGNIFYQYVLQGIEQERECLRQIESLADTPAETLRIGIGRWRGGCILPHILPFFQEHYPHVKLEIIANSSDTMADCVAKKNIDLAIMGNYDHYPYLGSIPLRDERILLTANRSHPFVKELFSQSLGHTDLLHAELKGFEQENFVITSSEHGLSKVVESYFASINLHPQNIIRIDCLNTCTHMVSKGNYITFVPEIAIHDYELPSNLSFMTIGSPALLYPIGITYNKNTALTPTAKCFVEAVQTYYETNLIGVPHDPQTHSLSELSN